MSSRVADGRAAAVTVCPFWFQSAHQGSTDTAAARPAPSACTAVAPATTSLAYVTACLDLQEPSAMKVQLASKTPWDALAKCWNDFHSITWKL